MNRVEELRGERAGCQARELSQHRESMACRQGLGRQELNNLGRKERKRREENQEERRKERRARGAKE